MAIPASSTTPHHPTHYAVLGLTPSLLDSLDTSQRQQHPSSMLLKRAYHGALLRHHPDKQIPSSCSSPPPRSASTSSRTPPSNTYTIDQIATAFAVLSSPHQRAAYDAALRQARALTGSTTPRFQTGVEDIDLDDLRFDQGTRRWHRSCRCGNERGYLFGEDDLVPVEEEGVLLVGCQDCSLWLRVHFAVVDDGVDPTAFKEERINNIS